MTRRSILILALSISLGSTAFVWAEDGPSDAFFDSAGVKIHYVTHGEGDPVVLIHGFTGNARFHWAAPNGPMMKLGQTYRVIALDNRGHGLSGKPHDPKAYGARMADDVVRLLDHLDIAKAHLVGYSMGGFITMKVLTTYPQRVISAVVGGAGWMQSSDNTPDSPLNRLADALDKGEGFGPLFEALTPEGEKKPSAEQIRLRTQLIAASNDLEALAAVARGMSGLAVTESQLRGNGVPTLCFVGGIDPLKESADRLDGVMSHLEMQVLDGADHSRAARSPEFLKAVQAHVARHSQAQTKGKRSPAQVGG